MGKKIPFTERSDHRDKWLDGKERRRLQVGYCHNRIHNGYVSFAQLKEHQCVQKNCPFFECNYKHPIWKQMDYHKVHKKVGKLLRKYYLKGVYKQETYAKLVSMLEKCDNRAKLIRFCNYLQDKRKLDIPESLYNEVIPYMNE